MSDLDLTYEKPHEIDGWMMAMMTTVIVGYAWLASVVFEPKMNLPSGAISALAWVEGSAVKDWQGVRKTRSLQLVHVARELTKAESEIAVLGGFKEAPALLIFIDDQARYVVSDTRIEIAESIAMSRGQLRKALIKAWLLQQRPKTIATQSLLRLEVVSDVLGAMLSSDAKFGVEHDHARFELPEPDPWIRFAGSLDALCGSAWASLDLQGRCGKSKRVHELSFRPLLAGMIWAVYRRAPTFSRFDLMRAWAAELNAPSDERKESMPANLAGWKKWLAAEYRDVFPIEAIAARAGLSENDRNEWLRAAKHVETAVELLDARPLTVNFVFQADHVDLLAAKDLPQMSSLVDAAKSFIVIDRTNGARLFPGDVSLDKADLRDLSTPLLVWESCTDTRLGALLGSTVSASRYLYVHSCLAEGRLNSWAGLARTGLGGFSESRAEAEFVQLHKESVELAVRKGLFSKVTRMSLLKSEQAELLGLDQPVWRRDIGAYRVHGAIEAVEWYRWASGRAL